MPKFCAPHDLFVIASDFVISRTKELLFLNCCGKSRLLLSKDSIVAAIHNSGFNAAQKVSL